MGTVKSGDVRYLAVAVSISTFTRHSLLFYFHVSIRYLVSATDKPEEP